MDFDKIKDEWNNGDTDSSNEITAKELKVKEAQTPIDRIRRQMKHEFKYQILSLVILAFVPKLFHLSPQLYTTYLVFYGIVVAFCTHYFYKFYTFYKHSYDLSLDSRKNLFWFYYEMKLNIELYKALNYIIAFIMLSFCATVLFLTKDDLMKKVLERISIIYIALNAFVTILIIGLVTEFWARFYYGKHVKRLKIVIDSLDEE